MNLISFVIPLLLSVFLAGCVTKSNAPEWVDGNHAKYRNSQYLTGKGQASTLEDAKNRARADLAGIFQVAISAESDDMQRYKSNSKNGEGEFVQESSRRVNTRTDQVISGIQIAEIWQDPARRDYHALAILPRAQAEEALTQQIKQLDDAIRVNVEQAKAKGDLFVRIASIKKAIDTQVERDGLQKSLQVVDSTGRGIAPKFNTASLRNDMEQLLRQVRVAPRVLEGSTAGFEKVVAGALSQAGFMVEAGDNPDFTLMAGLSLNDLGLKDGWYWQRGTLEITLTETLTGRTRGTQRWVVKSSSTEKNNAVQRAMDEADAILKQELGKAVIGMAISR